LKALRFCKFYILRSFPYIAHNVAEVLFRLPSAEFRLRICVGPKILPTYEAAEAAWKDFNVDRQIPFLNDNPIALIAERSST
jgi:hypothetical protein